MNRYPDIRYILFLLAFAVYGAFGSPTPDRLGPAELVCGGLLLAALPLRNLMQMFLLREGAFWRHAAQFLLTYGLCVPLLLALAAGNDPAMILRDLIPFVFLLLPLFFMTTEGAGRWWPVAAMVGVLFAVRVVAADGADPLYLSISPCVVFAAIILMAYAGAEMMRGVTLQRFLRAVALVFLSGLCLMALATTLQRASLALTVLALFGLLALAFWRMPLRAVVPGFMLLVLLAVFAGPVADVLAGLVHKQGTVGLNMRMQEAAAVFDAITVSPLHVLFGLGWGAQLESPAVGGMSVNYTHSLLTFIWLKAGLVGLLGVILYLWALGMGVVRAMPKNPVLAVALAVPLLIDIFLYASFKSLDFGLILLVCAALARRAQNRAAVAPGPDLVYR